MIRGAAPNPVEGPFVKASSNSHKTSKMNMGSNLQVKPCYSNMAFIDI